MNIKIIIITKMRFSHLLITTKVLRIWGNTYYPFCSFMEISMKVKLSPGVLTGELTGTHIWAVNM